MPAKSQKLHNIMHKQSTIGTGTFASANFVSGFELLR